MLIKTSHKRLTSDSKSWTSRTAEVRYLHYLTTAIAIIYQAPAFFPMVNSL
jgi:hypothetical protein